MKNLISFCLWGNKPKYCIGAIKNADLALQIYPEWKCRFYCNKDVPIEIITKLIERKNTEVIILNQESNWKFAASRFYAISDYEYDYIIFRDTDSRLSLREKGAVEDWIKSNKTLHIMKDHPGHSVFPIFAGMFGIKGKTIPNISEILHSFQYQPHFLNKMHTNKDYNYDQVFLERHIYPILKENLIIHDEIFSNNPFPLKRNDYEFIGEVFDENDKRNQEHRNALINFLNS
jgi:protein O-GlcNAc transferase